MTRSVLLVVSSLSAGGAERVVQELASFWAAKGWRVGVLTLSSPQGDHYRLPASVTRFGLALLNSSANPLQSLRNRTRRVRALRSAVRSFVPDVVVSFVDRTNVLLLFALLGCSVPTVVSERIDPRRYQIGLFWTLGRALLYPRAAAVVVQTDSVALWAERLVPKQKIRVIPNFVPNLRVPSRGSPRRTVLGVGRLNRQKGFDLLLEAYARSGVRRDGYRLVILGEGPERAALEELAAKLGVADVVEMPGVVSAPEDWMEQAAVFVLASRFEGFPNVLVEAMAMGCAVVAADCPSGPREIVSHGENGLLVPVEDVPALSQAIASLVEDDRLRDRLAKNAIAVRERLAAPAILGRWERLLNDILTA
jgi:glycosyltransferase involved in cell wall biosynthesis